MQAKSARGRSRVGTGAVGALGCLLVAGLLVGCTSGSEDRSGDDQSQTVQPPAAVAPDSSVALPQQQDPAPAPPPAESAPSPPIPPPDGEEESVDSAPPVDSTPSARPDPVARDQPPTLAEVLMQHMDSLTSIRGVVGVDSAACNGAPCIQITVARRTQKILAELPVSLEGYPVTVVERGGGH